jgi:hypothetical protein
MGNHLRAETRQGEGGNEPTSASLVSTRSPPHTNSTRLDPPAAPSRQVQAPEAIIEDPLAAIRRFMRSGIPLTMPVGGLLQANYKDAEGNDQVVGSILLPIWQGTALFNPNTPYWLPLHSLMRSLKPALELAAKELRENSLDFPNSISMWCSYFQQARFDAGFGPEEQWLERAPAYKCFRYLRISANMAMGPRLLGFDEGNTTAVVCHVRSSQALGTIKQVLWKNFDEELLNETNEGGPTLREFTVVQKGMMLEVLPFEGELYTLEFITPKAT